MNHTQRNRTRAAFLLLVFSLNTLAGFACSIGLNMGYNAKHHPHVKADTALKCSHTAHQHKEAAVPGQPRLQSPNDDCCAKQVNSFALLDKSVVHNHLFIKAPVYPIAIPSWLATIEKQDTKLPVNSRFQFVRRSCSLDHTDIRIAIRSFQV